MIAAEQPARDTAGGTRVQSIDILRGAVMIVMALDHVRDFLHSAALSFSPEDLSRTTAALFFTRWITHFCAPLFMLTAGLGVFLWGQRGKSPGELSRFLWTRGVWLLFLDLSVVRLGFDFNFDHRFFLLNVIWALGGCMIGLALLVRLPWRVLAVVSCGMILLHNLADGVNASEFGGAAWIWNELHQLGTFQWGGRTIQIAYPLIPWIGVMGAGYCLGRVWLWEPVRRRRSLIRLGLALTVAFVLVRALNLYGDPAPWSVQSTPLFTLLSFLRCSKYPPSLDFLLMTLGPGLLALGLLERVTLARANPLLIFGRVPLFYFVVHLYLIHALAMFLAFLRYGTGRFLFNPLPSMGGPPFPPGYGYELWVCYVAWVGLVLSLYPLCRWFAGVKRRRRDWWLSYL
jgi:uncharacterized membrane protein